MAKSGGQRGNPTCAHPELRARSAKATGGKSNRWYYPWAEIEQLYFAGHNAAQIRDWIIQATPGWTGKPEVLQKRINDQAVHKGWAKKRREMRVDIEASRDESLRKVLGEKVSALVGKAFEVLAMGVGAQMRWIVAYVQQHPGIVEGKAAGAPDLDEQLRFGKAQHELLNLVERLERRLGIRIDTRELQPVMAADDTIELPQDVPDGTLHVGALEALNERIGRDDNAEH